MDFLPASVQFPSYDDAKSFYSGNDAGAKRKGSPEIDFGVDWRNKTVFPQYSLTWVEATGELYLRDHSRNGRLAVLAIIHGREEIERSLDGWEKVLGRDGIEWLLNEWPDLGAGLARRSDEEGGAEVSRAHQRQRPLDPTIDTASKLLYG